MASPHVGDIGTPIIMTVYKHDGTILDLSTSGSKLIYLINPSGSRILKEADFTTDGTDGKMQYTVEDGVLNIDGQWRLQGFVSYSNGSWYTDIQGLTVLSND